MSKPPICGLQLALASRDDIVAFAPEPIVADDVRRWTETIVQRARRALGELARRRSELAENDRQRVDALLSYRDSLPARLRELLPEAVDAMKIRHHGDFHLGQMLIVKDDVSIIDFEGEPRRSIEDRRCKAPAARDVAGLIRSIDYSATAALERALKSAPARAKPQNEVTSSIPEGSVRKFLHDHIDPGVFAPDAVRTLIAAFDGAWQSISTSGARLSGQQRELTRELLAKYIIAQARQGELDERRLRDGALLHLARSNLRRPPREQK